MRLKQRIKLCFLLFISAIIDWFKQDFDGSRLEWYLFIQTLKGNGVIKK